MCICSSVGAPAKFGSLGRSVARDWHPKLRESSKLFTVDVVAGMILSAMYLFEALSLRIVSVITLTTFHRWCDYELQDD